MTLYLFHTFLFAGLRKGEMVRLKCTDVDLENMAIFIRQGKWHKDRVIPICDTLGIVLKNYMGKRLKMDKTCPEFFCSITTNSGLTVNG